MIQANEIKKGGILRIDGTLFKAMVVDHLTGSGRASAFVSTKLKNMSTGHIAERKFDPHDKIEDVDSKREKMDFLYVTGNEVCFMNPENFEQVSLAKEKLGHMVAYLKEGMHVDVEFVEENAVGIIPPELVEVKVESTTDPIKGETDSVYKPAILENGQEILVAPFIKNGDIIHVRVETGEYVDRVKEHKKD